MAILEVIKKEKVTKLAIQEHTCVFWELLLLAIFREENPIIKNGEEKSYNKIIITGLKCRIS